VRKVGGARSTFAVEPQEVGGANPSLTQTNRVYGLQKNAAPVCMSSYFENNSTLRVIG